jgi:hypothetical protein
MAERIGDSLKVWLDDRREPPDPTWTWITTPGDVIGLLRTGGVVELSLDHDLGIFHPDGREETGYDVLVWIEEQVVLHGFDPPRLRVHSANPGAHQRMERAIAAIQRLASGQQ